MRPTHGLRRDGKPITIDGHTLSIAAVAAAARFNAQVELTGSSATKQDVKTSRAVFDGKIASGISVYGVSTGFGGSGECRRFCLGSAPDVIIMIIKRASSQRTLTQAMNSLWDMLFCNISTWECSHHLPLR
jgi:hypothetical protein